MKKKFYSQILLFTSLILLSFIIYIVHYLIFKDYSHLVNYFLIDLGFVPVEVLFVTLIIHKLLEQREKKMILKKLNMVIGAFFSEVGGTLLESFHSVDKNSVQLDKRLNINDGWDNKSFSSALLFLKEYNYTLDFKKTYLSGLKKELIKSKSFLLGLLENPNLLEHDDFTNLLWAVFHLAEELEQRKNFIMLPKSDIDHIKGDIIRAYRLLLREWLSYIKHLKSDYPYLYSLAARTSVFNPESTAVIK